ncbi:MAG TPA: CBS domain-containing protein, partial [Gammaproteobacteria bacterium]|nr:CBS domain-containing protein [Gammaproteobacteria bacterium]
MSIENSAAAHAIAAAYIDLNPGEVAETLESASVDEVVEFLSAQKPSRAASVLDALDETLAEECVRRLSEESLKGVLAETDPAKAAVLLSRLEDDERDARMAKLDTSLANELRELMSYPEDSAGHLMETRVPTFRPGLTVKETLERLRSAGEPPRFSLMVVDDGRKLLGLLTLADIVIAEPGMRLEQLIKTRPPAIHAMAPREDVVAALTQARLRLLPVVDGQDRLLGVIRHDALVKAVQEDAAGDLAALFGAGKEERALSSPLVAVKKRLPWLNINLLTAFLAASVVGLFESTIAQFTALAVLLPVVAGQSGNTGAQALAVTMRGLALREVRARHWLPVAFKEAVAGALNGIAIALVTGLGVLVWSQSFGLTLVIFLAMILS